VQSRRPPQIDPAYRNLALLVAGTFFIEMLDGTIVTTSAPKIARALHVPVGSISLLITAYLVTQGVLIPLSGWVTARVGGRRAFMGAIVLFTVASIGCAASSTLTELVLMRVLQGVGGAMMVPVGRLLVISRADASNMLRVTALLVWPGLVAPVIAPLAGGVITTYANWHWLFLVNVPLGALALAVGSRVVRPQSFGDPGPLDRLGVLLTCAGLAALTLTANLMSEPRVKWALVAAFGCPAVVLLALAVRHLLRARHPLLELRLLRIHTFRTTLTGTAMFGTVIYASPFLAPLMFEEVFHWTAIKAGSIVLFIFLGNIGIKPATTYLYSRFGFRRVIVASMLTMAVSIACLGLVTAGVPLVLLAALMVVIGCARSVGATGQTTVVFSDVPHPDMRHASTLQSTVQQLAAGSGVALSAIALRLGRPLASLFASAPSAHAEYAIAFGIVACVALLAAINARTMRPGAGDALRGAHAPEAARAAVGTPSG
jgi:EmrB/QacA subfamily drug resistance transporter